MNTRRMGNVDRAVFDGRAVFRRLGDGIHLGVDGAKAVLLGVTVRGFRFVNQTADISAMGHARRRPVISGGKDVFVAHDHRADLCASAGRALSHVQGDRHEVLIPT